MKDWSKATEEERQAEQVRRLQQARQQGPRRAVLETVVNYALVYGTGLLRLGRHTDDGTCERCGGAHGTRTCTVKR